jgi:hypothetical protein
MLFRYFDGLLITLLLTRKDPSEILKPLSREMTATSNKFEHVARVLF